jgi:hypothetical protein
MTMMFAAMMERLRPMRSLKKKAPTAPQAHPISYIPVTI